MLAAIENRRSIRKYKENMLLREAIEKLLSAGLLAPSSKKTGSQAKRISGIKGFLADIKIPEKIILLIVEYQKEIM